MGRILPGGRGIEFLTREGCSLCDRLEARLAPVAGRLGIAVTRVDVEGDDGLRNEFGHRVPVVRRPDGTVLGEGDWGGPAMWLALLGVAVRPGPGGDAVGSN